MQQFKLHTICVQLSISAVFQVNFILIIYKLTVHSLWPRGLWLCGAKGDFIAKFDTEGDPELSVNQPCGCSPDTGRWNPANPGYTWLEQAEIRLLCQAHLSCWEVTLHSWQIYLTATWRAPAELHSALGGLPGGKLKRNPWVPIAQGSATNPQELSCKWTQWIETPGVKDTQGMDLSFPKHTNCCSAEEQLQLYQVCLDSWINRTDCLARETMYSQFPNRAGRPLCTF